MARTPPAASASPRQICRELYDAGADVITTGNHVWDQKETSTFIARHPRLLRPDNFPAGTPGNGQGLFKTADGQRVMVINLMGRLFMDALDDPFAVLVDAAGEMQAGQRLPMRSWSISTPKRRARRWRWAISCDGKVSVVVGHPHPCADGRCARAAGRHRLS